MPETVQAPPGTLDPEARGMQQQKQQQKSGDQDGGK
jgi:hypothetical protein